MKSKKATFIETVTRMAVTRYWWLREMGDTGQRVQTSSYKTSVNVLGI